MFGVRTILWEKNAYLVLGPLFNKCIETGFQLGESRGVYYDFRVKTRGDHPGVRFNLGVYGVFFECNFYDTRHGVYIHPDPEKIVH
jgi:hypothetical protein